MAACSRRPGAILFETFPREEQAMAQAFFGIIVIAGPAIGPTLGGYLVTNVDWRWIFFVGTSPSASPPPFSVSPCCRRTPRSATPGAWTGSRFFFLALGLGSMQTVLEEGNADDWFNSRFIVMLTCTTVIGIGGMIWRCLYFREPRRRSARPQVSLALGSSRSILSVVVGIALYGALFAIPLFAQIVLEVSPRSRPACSSCRARFRLRP